MMKPRLTRKALDNLMAVGLEASMSIADCEDNDKHIQRVEDGLQWILDIETWYETRKDTT